jgi:hypothetical protein
MYKLDQHPSCYKVKAHTDLCSEKDVVLIAINRTQLRCTASFLNHDLFKVHILSSPACSCGAPQEDANLFLFVCTKYSEIRNDLFLRISDLSQLSSGSETLSYADNCFIFYSVFRFMKRSSRYLIV